MLGSLTCIRAMDISDLEGYWTILDASKSSEPSGWATMMQFSYIVSALFKIAVAVFIGYGRKEGGNFSRPSTLRGLQEQMWSKFCPVCLPDDDATVRRRCWLHLWKGACPHSWAAQEPWGVKRWTPQRLPVPVPRRRRASSNDEEAKR